MGKDWARIHRDASQSSRLSKLFATNPGAEALYWRLKAWADDYGRFTADPSKFTMLVCARLLLDGNIALPMVTQAIADMTTCGLVRTYEVDGEAYLEIIDYDNHDAPNWLYVAAPEHPAPDDWVPPKSLVAFLLDTQDLKRRNITLKRYGITRENCPECLRHLLPASPVEPELTTVQLQSNDSSTTVELDPNCGATDSDVTTDTDTDTDNVKGTAPVADAPDAAPVADPEPVPDPTPADETPLEDEEPPGQADETDDADPSTRKDQAFQDAANACLAVWGLKHTDLSDKPNGKRSKTTQKGSYYAAMWRVVASVTEGVGALQAWADSQDPCSRYLGEGAKPERAIPEEVQSEVKAMAKRKSWDRADQAMGARASPLNVPLPGTVKTNEWGEQIREGAQKR